MLGGNKLSIINPLLELLNPNYMSFSYGSGRVTIPKENNHELYLYNLVPGITAYSKD